MAEVRYIKTKIWDDGWFIELSPNGKLMFIYLLTNLGTSLCGFYQRSKRNVVATLGFSEKEVDEALKEIEPKILYIDGWVCIKNYAKHQNAANSPKIQALIEKDLKEVPEYILEAASRALDTHSHSHSPSHSVSIGRVSIGYQKGKKTAQRSPKTPETTPVEKSGDNEGTPYSEGFETLWSAYPKKVGKGAAWTAWGKLKPQPKVAHVLSVIEKYRGTPQWKKDGGQYIPHFATFLNQRRFDDDPEGVSHEKSKYDDVPSTKIS